MFKYYNTLGFMNNFYIRRNNKLIIKENWSELLNCTNQELVIDPTAVIELLNNNYFFADRTIVQGIYKTPWMARPNSNKSNWIYAEIPAHGEKRISEAEAAEELLVRLKREIREYCHCSSNTGILLSGGMDSRIVAAVLDILIKSGELDTNVIALSWGLEGSRDVVYSKEIARRLGWDWLHFPLSAENLIKNIAITADNGCEFSPIHLHAMPDIRQIEGLDCILAASFGDSVGRGEYSGKSLTELKTIDYSIRNLFKLVNSDIYISYRQGISRDIKIYNELFQREENYQLMEIQRQAHYMRRQLNPCLAYINQRIPVYQVFTAAEVFGFVWSLSPEIRNNSIYYYLLDKFAGELREIPWSRTGKVYLKKGGNSDKYTENNHQYGRWIREDLFYIIQEKVISDSINSLNVFNMDSLSGLWRLNRGFSNQLIHTRIDEFFIWLASLSEMVEKYNIKGVYHEDSISDKLNARVFSKLELITYLTAKNLSN